MCLSILQAKEASKQLPVSELQPPVPRPSTSAATARRLIGAALGQPSLRDKVNFSQLIPCWTLRKLPSRH